MTRPLLFQICNFWALGCLPQGLSAAQHLSWPAITGIVLLNALGYLIFRASNNQKNLFRRDPQHPWVKQLKTLKTERGTELIMSGWWGISRHINYFGDWLLG